MEANYPYPHRYQDDLGRDPAGGAEEELQQCLQRPGQDLSGGGSHHSLDWSHANHSQVAHSLPSGLVGEHFAHLWSRPGAVSL